MNIRKTISVCALSVLLGLTVACGGQRVPEPSSAPKPPVVGGSSSETESEPEPVIIVRQYPQQVENPSNLPVLQWVCVDGVTISAKESSMRAVNAALAEKGLPFRLQITSILRENRQFEDLFGEPETIAELEHADLIYGCPPDAEILKKYYLPLTAYVKGEAQPSLQNAVPHAVCWTYTTWDSQIYGIGWKPVYPVASGWNVDEKVFTELGCSADDFHHEYWEMDEVFARLFNNNEKKPFLSSSPDGVMSDNAVRGAKAEITSALAGNLSNRFQAVGSCFGIDYRVETPVIVNILDTDYFRQSAQALRRYQTAGYCTTGADMLIGYNIAFSDIDCSYRDPETLNSFCKIPVGPAVTELKAQSANSPVGVMSGVAVQSQHREEALELLSLIASDAEFRNLLAYGVEGEDYTVQDGIRTTIPDANGEVCNLTHLTCLAPFGGVATSDDQFLLPLREGKDRLSSYRETVENSTIAYPLVFDYSAVQTQVRDMSEILKTYYMDFSAKGLETYDDTMEKLRKAGCEAVLLELNRQLTAWQAANPDWQASMRRVS